MPVVYNPQCTLKLDLYVIARESDGLGADLNRYTTYEANRQRLISIASSSISIFAGLVGVYFFLAISHRKRVFRHHLIIFLLLYDWIKAVCLLLYPAKVMATRSAYYDIGFCKVVGFFTAFSIEGSDLAIMSFAIHLALLIYRPNERVKRGINYEGGLYRYRYFVYPVSVLVPVLLASLAFINDMGYAPMTNWCYIPSRPVWYRLVLSWIPRYIIMISIILIYACIYFHVKKQYKNVGNAIGRKNSTNESTFIKKTFRKLKGLLLLFKFRLTDEELSKHSIPQEGGLNNEIIQQFKTRRIQSEKQMRTIFIYPIAYVFLWIFPTILHGMDFRYGLSKNPSIWLDGVAAFMRPFNCTIDTLVFLIREKPWKITTIKVDTSLSENYNYYLWRRMVSFLPLFRLPEPLEIRQFKHSNPKQEISQIENSNSHDFSSILSGTINLNNACPESKEDHNINKNEHDSLSSKSTANSVDVASQNGRLDFIGIINNNKSQIKQLIVSDLSNDKKSIPAKITDEVDFEEFLKVGPDEYTNP